jgi:hypothetical protein
MGLINVTEDSQDASVNIWPNAGVRLIGICECDDHALFRKDVDCLDILPEYVTVYRIPWRN